MLVKERKFAYHGRQTMKPKIAYSYLSYVSKTVAQTRTSKRLIESAKKWCECQNLVFKPCVYETQRLGKKIGEGGLRNFLQEIIERKIQPGSVLILEDLPEYQTAPPHQTIRDTAEIIAHGVSGVSLHSYRYAWAECSLMCCTGANPLLRHMASMADR
jgi:hypothetical protein